MRFVRSHLSETRKKRFRKRIFVGLTPMTKNTIWGKSPALYLEGYVLVLFNHMERKMPSKYDCHLKKSIRTNLEGTLEGLFWARVPYNKAHRVNFRVCWGVLDSYYFTRISKKMFPIDKRASNMERENDVIQAYKK